MLNRNLLKRKIFTPENKVKAIARESVNALHDLYGEKYKAGYPLENRRYYPTPIGYFSIKSPDLRRLLPKSKQVRSIDEVKKRITKKATYTDKLKTHSYKLDDGIVRTEITNGCSNGDKVLINKKTVSTELEKRQRLRDLILHEVIHSMSLSKANPVTASAMQRYFRVFRQDKIGLNYVSEWEKKNGKLGEKTNVILGIDNAYEGKRTNREPETGPGEDLAIISANVEKQAGKPGVGLIMVRDVSMGMPVKESMGRALSGEYDNEAMRFLKRNPSLRRLLINTKHYLK
ncbi:MAG: hypothetical protein AABW59_02230 [archaeon]